MQKPNKSEKHETATGIKIGDRKRAVVIKDFEKISGPLRGQNQDQKPKA
jgi:hypothetical protein